MEKDHIVGGFLVSPHIRALHMVTAAASVRELCSNGKGLRALRSIKIFLISGLPPYIRALHMAKAAFGKVRALLKLDKDLRALLRGM